MYIDTIHTPDGLSDFARHTGMCFRDDGKARPRDSLNDKSVYRFVRKSIQVVSMDTGTVNTNERSVETTR